MLTPRQRKFAEHLAEHNHYADAYRHAFDCSRWSDNSINREGQRLGTSPKIVPYVDKLRNEAAVASGLVDRIAESMVRCFRIGHADPSSIFRVRLGNCRHCHGIDFGRMWRDDEYAEAIAEAEAKPGTPMPSLAGGLGWRPFTPPNENCPECGGAGVPHQQLRDMDDWDEDGRLLFAGIKPTKYGIEVVTHDQPKHLEIGLRVAGGFKDSLNLTGALGVVAKIAELAPDDPHAATKAYDDFLKAGS
jgi:phage terminase small subunit